MLILGVTFNLCLLGYYKYADFLIDNVAAIGLIDKATLNIVLPLAISFFTFQQIAFLVDSYKSITHEYSFTKYVLFVCFFPQLIAGPIVHHAQLIPQFSYQNIKKNLSTKVAKGLSIFTIGLSKKVLIADSLAPIANAVFDNPEQLTLGSVDAWVGAAAYTLQIYFDFSGYSDMAIGLALMFGLYLPINFNSPYKAISIIDFWRRWHMTLSAFLRDYLYIALGGNRKGGLRRYSNLLITMLLGGLWHGANWTFVMWGAMHGVYLVINHSWRYLLNSLGRSSLADSGIYKLLALLLTFFCVLNSWVVFRAASIDDAMALYQSMYSLVPGQLYIADKLSSALGMIAAALAVAFVMPNSLQIIQYPKTTLQSMMGRFFQWRGNALWGATQRCF
ncbi:MBOAT family O-acyltransferase [Oceanicoccus sagamiensis]|uniref:MBOAT family O-acyltransferase n=1 Tax=Oceanicoccus sagamiensis TaxID=716816 RepID=UPI0012F49C63|nr:MBOAT family O-acyltransferase [Oceanicoccus sagamiensis]